MGDEVLDYYIEVLGDGIIHVQAQLKGRYFNVWEGVKGTFVAGGVRSSLTGKF